MILPLKVVRVARRRSLKREALRCLLVDEWSFVMPQRREYR